MSMREYGTNINDIESLLDFLSENFELRILFVFDGCDIFVNRSSIQSSVDCSSKHMSYKNVLQNNTVNNHTNSAISTPMDNSHSSNVNHIFKELIDTMLRRSRNVTFLNLTSKGPLIGLLSHEHEKIVLLPPLNDSASSEFLIKIMSPKVGIKLFETDVSCAQIRLIYVCV